MNKISVDLITFPSMCSPCCFKAADNVKVFLMQCGHVQYLDNCRQKSRELDRSSHATHIKSLSISFQLFFTKSGDRSEFIKKSYQIITRISYIMIRI